ncbi:PPC domain-containing DNA-binding protein [Photobacterium damselae subsp. damselae]|uniref:PPC domain-containing DNA-binding protein n=1 Tax=Photobacterium damselae TaxID=38293 RepID=UPI00311B4044
MVTPHALRLTQGQDLRQSILDYVVSSGIQAGSLVTGVGCLESVNIRLASATQCLELSGPLEILSLAGTLTPEHVHIHISVADKEGHVYGGHLQPGSIVSYTCELCLVAYDNLAFSRAFDTSTGYTELAISSR